MQRMHVSSYTIILEIQLYDINIHYNTVNMIKLSLLKTEMFSNSISVCN